MYYNAHVLFKIMLYVKTPWSTIRLKKCCLNKIKFPFKLGFLMLPKILGWEL